MDEISKYRLTGAFIWLLLLVVLVPSWYNSPVNFKPAGHQKDEAKGEHPLVEHIYELPVKTAQKQAALQSNPLTNNQLLETAESINDSNDEPKVPTASQVTGASDASERQEVSLKTVQEPVVEITQTANNVAPSKAKSVGDSAQKRTPAAITEQWIVRITAYKDIKQANHLLGRLESNYDVSIKEFKNSGTYSVRTGPYISKAKAEQDKRKLDKMLRTNAEVVPLH